MEKFFLKIWYQEVYYANLASLFFIPLSCIYISLFYLRALFYKNKKFNIPIICIGNINIGGTGKTSTLLTLIKEIKKKDKRVSVLLRGYGSKNKSIFYKVSKSDTFNKVGDEALLYANCVPTYITTNRNFAIERIINEKQTDILLLDDGFQDRSFHKDKTILTVNGKRGFGNKMCLPAGPLRELIRPALKSAQFVVIIGDDLHHITKKYDYDNLEFYNANIKAVDVLDKKRYFAFSGIGNNDGFFDTLKNEGYDIKKKKSFPDHYQFTRKDLESLLDKAKIENLSLITTEKDYVRIPEDYRKNIDCFKIKLEIPNVEKLIRKLIN